METYSKISKEDEQMELPPGFRFHPTDEELITHYLSKKVVNNSFNAIAIGEVDFNKVEPWDLPNELGKAKMGVKEWYFFCMKDSKYPTGLRTNRATETGYWKATGKDKEIHRDKSLIGMKKTLVFYTGRAPKGAKTNWVMHEYRLDGEFSKLKLSKTTKNEWVLSRVFDRGSSEKQPNHPEFMNLKDLHPRCLPPLMDSSSPHNSETKAPIMVNSSNVTCFSSHHLVVEDKNATRTRTNTLEDYVGMISTTNLTNPCSSSLLGSKFSLENSRMEHGMEDPQYTDSIFIQDQSILKLLLEGKGPNMIGSSKIELSEETGLSVGDMNTDMCPMSNFEQINQYPTGPGLIDLDYLWDY